MERRGVTRPMALRDVGSDADGHDPQEMLQSHHTATLWIPWTVILLGIWTIVAPFSFGYLNEDLWARPSGGRGVWFSGDLHLPLRAWLMTLSDVASGALLAVLGWRSLRADRPVTRWAACLVGIWLVFAPVVFWSPTASGYLNDSIVGMLVIALLVLIPGMPNMVKFMVMGAGTPPGWSYNPSSWPQRSILIALGFAGLLVSRYLAAYQLGFIDSVWDPFFGFSTGTKPVLDSQMSHTWPVSDAALGTAAYTFEFLMGFMGSEKRWRTMPWMVAMFGVLVIPLGLSHIALVMSQPVVVHQFSTFALLAAAIMLPMVTLTVDEVVAMAQHLRDAGRRGDRSGSTWKVFWLGGEAEGSSPDERTPAMAAAHERPAAIFRASLWGASASWGLVAVLALGLVLLALPSIFGITITSGAADVAHIGGAFVVVVAVVAMGEVVRALRLLNVPAGLLIAALAVLTSPSMVYAVVVALTGVAVAVASLPRGPVRERYGNWRLLTR